MLVETTCFRSPSSHLNNAACSCLSNADTLRNTSAPHSSVGSASGIGARFQSVGVRRCGSRSSRRLSVACSGPSNITLCCQVQRLRHSDVEVSCSPSPCEGTKPSRFSQARSFSNSDAPGGRPFDEDQRILHSASSTVYFCTVPSRRFGQPCLGSMPRNADTATVWS